jgi:hypothetical protein
MLLELAKPIAFLLYQLMRKKFAAPDAGHFAQRTDVS